MKKTRHASAPSVVVGVVVENPRGEVLLVRQPKWGGRWTLPGGHVEYGERLADAVKREMREETGLRVTRVRFLSVNEGVFPKTFWKRRHFLFVHHTAKPRGGRVRLNDEANAFQWLSPKRALKLRRVEAFTRLALKEFLRVKKR